MVNLKISLETQRQVERAQVRKGGLPPLNLLKSSTWKGTTQLQQGTSKEGWFTPAQPTQKLNLERDHSTTTSASKEGWFTPAQFAQKLNLERDHSTTTSASKEGWFTPAQFAQKLNLERDHSTTTSASKEGWFTPAQFAQKLNLERDHSTTIRASKEGWFTPAQLPQKLNLERDHSTTTSASKEGWFTPACSPKKAFSFLSLISQDFSFQRSSSPTPSLLLTAFLNHHPTTNPDPQPTAHLCPSRMRGSWTRDNPSPTL